MPDRFLRAVVGFELPPVGAYAVGLAFLPLDPEEAAKAAAGVETIVDDEGLRVLGWRDVPIDPTPSARRRSGVMPSFRQVFLADPAGTSGLELDRKLFFARKRIEHEVDVAG